MRKEIKYRIIFFLCCLLLGVIILLFFLFKFKKDDEIEKPSSHKFNWEMVEIKGKTYYISPTGNDEFDGETREKAWKNINKGIEVLNPGDGLILLDGIYQQDFSTVKDGELGKEIIIKGSPKAVIEGFGDDARIIEINHDYIVLAGFTVDGLSERENKEENYRDKLIFIEGKEEKNGVTGVKILGMNLKNSGGECLRIKYFSTKNEIAYNKISYCGAYDFIFKNGGKNGEGIYVGTAPEQIKKGKNITKDIDNSNENWIHDNNINTQGNECVDIKEGSSLNLVEKNICTGQKDKESAGLDSRGNKNIFRDNEIFSCLGAGIRLGGDDDDDGINNDVIGNKIYNNSAGGIKIQRKPQGKICANIFSANKKGDFVGEYGEDFKNKDNCE